MEIRIDGDVAIIDGVEYVPKVTPEVTPEVPDYPLPLQEGDVFESGGGFPWRVVYVSDNEAYCLSLDNRFPLFVHQDYSDVVTRIISRKPLHERVRLGDRVRIYGSEYKVASIYGASEKVVLGSDARQFNFADFDANAELLPREE